MPDYNFLKGNESDFPHVDNINVYKYDNDFDYGRFDAPQMELQICSVPWDMGEAHIGNRTISGIGNVVYFGTKAKRDEWFDAIPDSQCYRFTTKFKELHRSLEIDVPIPYDMCAKHNYLRVKYNKLANDNSHIAYEENDGLREWFWFIREVEFLAPSTTRLHLLDDAFQTWIYDVNVSGMVLERGHAPMFAVDVDDYLANPLNNNTPLLTEDVNFGNANIVKHSDAQVFNDGDMIACVACTGDPRMNWGTKEDGNWNTPASAAYYIDGCPSAFVFGMKIADLETFLVNVTVDFEQFKQTVKGIFFASEKLVTPTTEFEFAGITCFTVHEKRRLLDFVKLEKGMFGYDSKYSEIAKLYTSPYSHIEVTDENGNVDIVKVEDTAGELKINAAMNLAFPFINIDAHLIGAGGRIYNEVKFRNITQKSFGYSGQWYETLRSWKVPMFAVVLTAKREYDYSTHFDRAQQVVDYTTAKDNEYASATTARQNAHDAADTMKTNADASADTMKTNADASADTLTANAALTMAANSATVARSNTSANDSLGYTQTYNSGMAVANNIITGAGTASTIAANEMQGAISAASGMAQSTVGAIASAATGNVAGAVTGVVNGAIGAAGTLASTAVANGLTATMGGLAQTSNTASATASNTKSSWDTSNQTSTATDLADIQNNLTDGTSANSAATMKSNASRDQTTQKANATRDQTTQKANATRSETTAKANADRTADAAQSAIDNAVKQAALSAPSEYGTWANGEYAATKPMGMFANIVTQSRSAIARAGDEFLRYGYMYDGQWDFDGNWNIGKYFTYWKLRDFWVSNLNVPDMYMDKLRFFLFGGVTVWRSPEYIGNVTVYDNFN